MQASSPLRAIALFLLIAFGYSWTIAELYFRFWQSAGVPYAVIGVIYMYGPALAAVITVKWVKKEPLVVLGPIWRWHLLLLVTLALPAVFGLLTLTVSGLLPGGEWIIDSSEIVQKIVAGVPAEKQAEVSQQLNEMGGFLALIMIVSVAFSSVIAGATVNAAAAFGEELGWRGFLQKQLSGFGFWSASFMTGVCWGLWHLPLVLRGHNYPDHPVWGGCL